MLPDEARHVDDVSLGLAQVRQRLLAGHEEAHEVQLEEVAELLGREVVDRLVGRMPARVVDQAVEAAVPARPPRARGRGPRPPSTRRSARTRRGRGPWRVTSAASAWPSAALRAQKTTVAPGPGEGADAALADAEAAPGHEHDLVRVAHARAALQLQRRQVREGHGDLLPGLRALVLDVVDLGARLHRGLEDGGQGRAGPCPTATSESSGAPLLPGGRARPFFMSLTCRRGTRPASDAMSAAGSTPPALAQKMSISKPTAGSVSFTSVSKRVPPLSGHELVAVRVVAEPKAFGLRRLARRVEDVGRLGRVVGGEVLAVGDPGTDHEPATRVFASATAPAASSRSRSKRMCGAVADEVGRVERAPEGGRGHPFRQACGLHLADAEPPQPVQRARHVLGQVALEAPELEADRPVQRGLDLGANRGRRERGASAEAPAPAARVVRKLRRDGMSHLDP